MRKKSLLKMGYYNIFIIFLTVEMHIQVRAIK